MIQLEYISEKKKHIRSGLYDLNFSTLLIGSSNACDIVIESANEKHLLITLTKKGLLVSSIGKTGYFLSNGKKILGAKYHKINESIGIDDIELKILNFKFIEGEDIHQKFASLDEDIKQILEELEGEILYIEQELHVT